MQDISGKAFPPEMDKGNRAFYEVAFERDILRKKGNAFEEFFADLMEASFECDLGEKSVTERMMATSSLRGRSSRCAPPMR